MLRPLLQSLDLAARAGTRALSRADRVWVGVTLLAIVRLADAGTGNASRVPSSADALPDGEPLALRSPEDSLLARLAPTPSEAARPAGVFADGSDAGSARRAYASPADSSTRGVGGAGRAPWRSTTPLDAPLGLKQFRLEDFSTAEIAPRDFRPRAHSVFEPASPLKSDDSLMSDSDTWQRLANEYRAGRRVRVLTLWDTGWSSISLQAGKHGDPSLQWTGHLFGHSETHQGVLDRWVPTFSVAGSFARGEAHAFAGLPRLPAPSTSHAAAAVAAAAP